MKAPVPENEASRLAALRSYEILDTPQEQSLDDIVTLAAHICETPISLVTLVDEERQWFKAKVGLDLTETSRDDAFCAHTILAPDDILVIPDALEDDRFRDNRLVLSDPRIRFYAGAPLVTREGFALGSLCVIDTVPRELSAEQLAALRALRRDIVTELDLRRNLRMLGRDVQEGKRNREELLKVQQALESQALKRMAQLREAYEDLSALNRIVRACTGTLDLEQILDRVLDVAVTVTDLDGGTVCLVDADQTLHLAASRGASENTITDLTTQQIKVGECLCGNCALDLKPLILHNRDEVLAYSSREALRREEIFFHAAYPFLAGNNCVGVLCVFARSDREPTSRSLDLVETITAQVALAIENSRLYQQTLRHAEELEEKVRERTAELEQKNQELERINRLFVGRELRMRELKQRIAKLEQRANRKESADGSHPPPDVPEVP